MQELSDEELVAKSRSQGHSGSGDAWINELFRRYHTRVAAWCYRFTGDRESAADLAQDVFIKAYRNLGSFRGDAKFSTWLFTIARNHSVNEMKARGARPEQALDLETLNLESEGTSALATLEREESIESMRALIEQTLDETEKRVMVMHYADEIGLEAINRLLGLSNASGAKAYIVSAKRKLTAAAQRWKARSVPGTKK